MSSILHWHDERTDTEVCYYDEGHNGHRLG